MSCARIQAKVFGSFGLGHMPSNPVPARPSGHAFHNTRARLVLAAEIIVARFPVACRRSAYAEGRLSLSVLGKCSSAPREVRESEHALERAVSAVISDMPFLWLAIEDEPGPETLRGYIERNAISLLSNHGKPPLDPPAPDWLGQWCDRERVRTSGLWNSNHVDEDYDPAFLDLLEDFAGQMRRP